MPSPTSETFSLGTLRLVKLPRSLMEPSGDRALTLLRSYFAPLTGRDDGYTGGQFDTFDPSGTRAASTNTFTSDDLLSLTLLSAPVPGRAALELLERQRTRFESLLEDLGPDRELVDEPSVSRDQFAPAWALWQALDDLPGMGPTRVSKLMARKRPRLIPVFDDVLATTVFAESLNHWTDLWLALQDSGGALHGRLVALRDRAGLDESISALRVFDVCAWMDGTRNGDLAVAQAQSE